ncbi:hypothetical protein CFK38_04715 [Brachybacterium vulturis]|uniref:Uncharacterized protein n=1 Tax=Brachybacterium vulturis TaxID=2017484 RepID=A0A291GL43_9MICO|nr:hypothetical protein [Brachybacterium vulturis]ATG50908.1 hypothetical protein CFK38_04715 [Brachybacterium vulturis]
MTSTPMDHPEDDAHPHAEDQGEKSPDSTSEQQDLVDERTKELSEREAAQHDGIIEAQEDEKRDAGGYGH